MVQKNWPCAVGDFSSGLSCGRFDVSFGVHYVMLTQSRYNLSLVVCYEEI